MEETFNETILPLIFFSFFFLIYTSKQLFHLPMTEDTKESLHI